MDTNLHGWSRGDGYWIGRQDEHRCGSAAGRVPAVGWGLLNLASSQPEEGGKARLFHFTFCLSSFTLRSRHFSA